MRIPSLKKYQSAGRGKFFEDLTPGQRASAHQWLRRFIERRRARGLPLEPWRRAILYGQATRLAKNPPSSAWGRSMRAKKGGYAVQRKYRLEGRNPTVHDIPQSNCSSNPIAPPESANTAGGKVHYTTPHQRVTIYRGVPVPGKW